MTGKTVSVQEDFVMHKKLEREYPEINLLVSSARSKDYMIKPIRDVSVGQADAFIGNLLMTTYRLQKEGYTNVKVAAPTPFDNHNQSMGIRNDWPELVSIINKTLDSMTPEEHAAIRNKWLSVRFEYGISPTDVLKWVSGIIGAAALILVMILLWNRKLSGEIQERKRAEEALRESEGKYRGLVEGLDEAMYRMSLPDGKYEYMSPSARKVFGYSAEEFIEDPLTIRESIHPDFAEYFKEKWADLIEGKFPPTYTYKILDPEGNERWIIQSNTGIFDDSGNIIAIEGLCRDITKEVQAEKALRESEEKYRSMMESMNDSVHICSPDFHVEYINPAMIKRIGRNAIGEHCFKAINGLEDKCPWCVHNKVQQGESCVTEIVSPKDSRIYYVSHSPIRHVDGSISKLTIYRDITEIRNMEKQLQHVQKMEAIATLAGGVAHEFNNSLMGIMGHIELLKMNFPKDEGQNRYLDTMNIAGHRMSRLTDQLLAYAQGGKYRPKNLKLDDFVIETLPILQHDLSSAVRVETRFAKDISHINADNAQMQMVLTTILANSNEAIEDKGIIRITAENKDVDDDLAKQNPDLKPGRYVCLTIEDDGKGMDEEIRKGIFEPFFTTKFQGRGMGMAAVYGIVRNHDGWISVDSELGRGTKIQIYLPAIEVEIKKPIKTKPEVATGSGTILMIEDEDVVIEVTQAMLGMLGYRVMVAKTGKDAIHIAETFDGQIDLALLDIKLPDIDGRNLYPLIMEARSNLKVIVFSGYSIDGPAREILDAGAQDFLQKPFSIATLSEKLKEVLEDR